MVLGFFLLGSLRSARCVERALINALLDNAQHILSRIVGRITCIRELCILKVFCP